MKHVSLAFLLLLSTFSAFAQEREYFDEYHDKVKQKEAAYYQVTTTSVNEAGKSRYFVETHYLSDTLRSTGYYSDKKLTVKDGAFTYFRENGHKQKEEAYTDNKLNGRYVEYFRNDRISEEKFYSNGKLEGKSLRYYKNGNVMSEWSYLDDKAHGEWLHYYENGKLSHKATYVNGKTEGAAFGYFDDGQTDGEMRYVDGKLEGECRWYYKNGQVSSIEHYAAGSLQSFELYNEDGSRDTISETPGNGPEYRGGMPALRKFLAENIRYPQIAMEHTLQGKVYLTFIITPQGRIKNIEVLKGIEDCPECDAESVRVVGMMPNWIPSKSHNRWIDQPFNLPITFTLQ